MWRTDKNRNLCVVFVWFHPFFTIFRFNFLISPSLCHLPPLSLSLCLLFFTLVTCLIWRSKNVERFFIIENRCVYVSYYIIYYWSANDFINQIEMNQFHKPSQQISAQFFCYREFTWDFVVKYLSQLLLYALTEELEKGKKITPIHLWSKRDFLTVDEITKKNTNSKKHVRRGSIFIRISGALQ